MIQQDTTNLISDSLSAMQADSLSKMDSLARVDSLYKLDSLRLALAKPTGFSGLSHPSLPVSENWVFIALVSLFVLLIISIINNPVWIRESVRTFFQVNERSSYYLKNSSSQFQTRFLLLIFNSGVFSLYSLFLYFEPALGFQITKFFMFYAVMMAFLIFKEGTGRMLAFVFLDKSSFRLMHESYFNTLSYLAITLFPILILQIYFPDNLKVYAATGGLILCIIAAILIIIKLFQIFFHKSISFFYILLYLCTLEILPLMILFEVYRLLL